MRGKKQGELERMNEGVEGVVEAVERKVKVRRIYKGRKVKEIEKRDGG